MDKSLPTDPRFADFSQQGYSIISAERPDRLTQLRSTVFAKARELIGADADDPIGFLNGFHRRGLSGAALNDFRLELIRYLSQELDVDQLVFDAFENALLQLIGPDIVVQKTINLVIQQPGDPDVVPTHRDAPLNSPFEIIVWLPLVDVYGTKSMYLLDRAQSQTALAHLRDEASGHQGYSRYAAEHGKNLEVQFGDACFFWTALVHGCHINQAAETRWSLNIRYKNLFSPYGSKGLPDFFKLFRLSPLAKLAFDFERQAYR